MLKDPPSPAMSFSPDEIRSVARKMNAWTAHGVDRLGPRDFLLLSDQCLEALNALWSWMLRDGMMPSQISLTLQPALPKPDGEGHRLIALLNMTVRLRSRCTRGVAAKWELDHPKGFSYGTKGKACERAVWEQAFAAARASINRFDVANVLIDLTKAYERVKHLQSLSAARQHSFSLYHLRLCLVQSSCPRVLLMGPLVSRPTV
eukprot:2497158-Pyramimonas_sp.AAC.1